MCPIAEVRLYHRGGTCVPSRRCMCPTAEVIPSLRGGISFCGHAFAFSCTDCFCFTQALADLSHGESFLWALDVCRMANMQKKPIPSKKWTVYALFCRAYRFSWRKYSDIEGNVSPLDDWYYGNKSLLATLRRLGADGVTWVDDALSAIPFTSFPRQTRWE